MVVSSISQTVQVNPLPVVAFTGLSVSYCSTNGIVTLTGTPAGGVFSGSGCYGDSFLILPSPVSVALIRLPIPIQTQVVAPVLNPNR